MRDFFDRRSKYNIREERSGYKVFMWLVIRSFGRQDIGTYNCVSTNSLGRAEGTLRLYGQYIVCSIAPVLYATLINDCGRFHVSHSFNAQQSTRKRSSIYYFHFNIRCMANGASTASYILQYLSIEFANKSSIPYLIFELFGVERFQYVFEWESSIDL